MSAIFKLSIQILTILQNISRRINIKRAMIDYYNKCKKQNSERHAVEVYMKASTQLMPGVTSQYNCATSLRRLSADSAPGWTEHSLLRASERASERSCGSVAGYGKRGRELG